jgi:hypothetical protein
MLFKAFSAAEAREQDLPAVCRLHDAQIQIASDANVKRACMAAENVDAVADHSKMLAVLVLGKGKTVAGPPSAGFGG